MDSRRPPFVDSAAGALLDADGRIVRWTREAERLLSLPADEVCGRPVRELLADPAGWDTLLAGHRTARAAERTAGPPAERAAERPADTWSGTAVLRSGRGGHLGVVFQVLPLADTTAGEPAAARYFVLAAPARLVTQWRQDQAFTRELFLQDRVGLAVFDDQLRLVRTNTHLLPYTGLPPDLTGRRLGDFLQAEDAEAVERQLREVLRTGRPLVISGELVRTIEAPRSGAAMAISAFRLQTADGQVIGVTALFTDVTALHRSGERLAVLHRATAAVGGSLSVTGTAEDLAAVLVPGLADLAVVDVAEAVFTGEEPAPGRDGRLPLRRTAVTGATELLTDAEASPGAGPDTVAVAVAFDDTEGAATATDPTATAPAPTTMTAPLRARGSLLGRVTVHRAAGRIAYEPADLDLLHEIAARAALALDNARRYTREHRAAVSLQRSLLPPAQTETAAVTTASVYLPTDTAGGVGGDWFDVIPLSSARVALVAGDVVGHGLEASATMGRLRTAVRTLADLDLEPDELLVHLDDLVCQLLIEADEPEDEGEWPTGHRTGPFGATCVYAVYDPVSRRCAMASAGHPPPAVAAPDGTVEYVPVRPGPPLGVSGLPFEATEVELAPGSVLALYTDGLILGYGGDLDEGLAELRRRMARPGAAEAPLPELGRELVDDHPAHRLADDVTLLLARTRAVPPEATAAWSLEADPAAVARVRESATERLRAWGLEDLVFTTELVLSELVTNAIRYAGGPVQVRLIRAERLTCEVSDPSATQPRMRRARLTDEGGRGLYLVAQLTNRWGSRYTRNGKTIWAEQELP
ncbi:SpoIIE family protein phosphatase [Kitasatospora sp. NPDC059327]|uniref:SpoIIE family protein phosphatase n=1 Tax=Kitasatospora sp. NPDC059327 TaxID=3346803 RepID=UPI0036B77484